MTIDKIEIYKRMVKEADKLVEWQQEVYTKLHNHGFRHRPDGGDTMFFIPFGSDITVSVEAGGTYTIPAGVYYVACGLNTKVQIYIGGAWRNYVTAEVVLVFSDGQNTRLYNSGTEPENSTLRRVT